MSALQAFLIVEIWKFQEKEMHQRLSLRAKLFPNFKTKKMFVSLRHS